MKAKLLMATLICLHVFFCSHTLQGEDRIQYEKVQLTPDEKKIISDLLKGMHEKYGIKVFANPFYYTEKTDIGGFKYPRDEVHLQSIALFLKEMTLHFSQFSSLYGYVLINEPGGGSLPKTDFTKRKFEEWSKTHLRKEFTDKGYPVLMDLYEQAFQKDYGTWFLKWIAGEITKYDSKHEIHVNNHAMFQNCAEYDFPEWRKFLTSLGGSAISKPSAKWG